MRGTDALALNAKLAAVQEKLARGTFTAAANQLGAFCNQVRALVLSGRLPAPAGDWLKEAAGRLISQLEAG